LERKAGNERATLPWLAWWRWHCSAIRANLCVCASTFRSRTQHRPGTGKSVASSAARGTGASRRGDREPCHRSSSL
jgi:hypothetical protein